MTIKEEEALNKWLDEYLQATLIVKSSSRYVISCFYILKKEWITMISTGLLKVEPIYNKGQGSTTLNWKSNRQTQEGKIL